MSEATFPKALAFVLANEGGNDDDPLDHGGRTSRGITQREYDAWRREKGLSTRDVWTADQSEIEAIYHEEYWLPLGPTLPVGTDYLYFDMAVNAGPYRAAVLLQRALGVTPDGRIGPVSRAAIQAANPIALARFFSDEKRRFYRSLHQPRFLKGWLSRTDEVERNAISLIQQSSSQSAGESS